MHCTVYRIHGVHRNWEVVMKIVQLTVNLLLSTFINGIDMGHGS